MNDKNQKAIEIMVKREKVEMIDIHSHILPGIDDGAKTVEESIQMCGISYRDGVRTIVATPHTLNGFYLNDREMILTKLKELNQIIDDQLSILINPKALKNHPSSNPVIRKGEGSINQFRILPGADIRFCEKTLSHLDQGKIMTINDGNKFLFLEFPFQGIPYQAEQVLFQFMNRGLIPVISHPERNMEVGQKPQRYYEMIRMGCLGQVTAMSLTGEFGSRVKQLGEKLLKNRLIHFIASDSHSIHERPPILSRAVRAAEKIVGKEEAQKMVSEYPQAILEGRRPSVPDPIFFK